MVCSFACESDDDQNLMCTLGVLLVSTGWDSFVWGTINSAYYDKSRVVYAPAPVSLRFLPPPPLPPHSTLALESTAEGS